MDEVEGSIRDDAGGIEKQSIQNNYQISNDNRF